MENTIIETRSPQPRRTHRQPALGQFRSSILNRHIPLLLAALLSTAVAADYSLDWSTLDGGGGTSIGGVYAVSGAIGQPDAGTLSGGQFTLTGGFWVLPIAVQSSNAPTLIIVPVAPGWATIRWSPNTPGFVLQETLNLTGPDWTNSSSG